ncbi:MAG: diguanylate cyclase [Sulfuricurvum sp. GWF2_44_89]|nr:EAL domain-containing protein [Sulfuricurvum sp. RIFOXYD12_FULL_44_77]OHD77272.1 MAG: diguanylate cyclase [Sulfuricurvum sp. GWF2_44_89]OHD91284.1 MAG: diguanylate cyclase [Sulfuricurvum sp. RIFOXYD12_FULL_44_77]
MSNTPAIEMFDPMEAIINNTEALVYVIDLTTYEIVYANDRCKNTFGDVEGKACYRVLQLGQNGPCDFCPLQQQSVDPLSLPIGTSFEWENQNTINKHHYLYTDRIIRWKNGQLAKVQVGIDITSQKKLESELKNLTHYDTLTTLPNRLLFTVHLSNMIHQANRSKHYAAILFIDLDHFKTINNTKGHSMGDLVLVEAAKRIFNIVRQCDTVARFGGDEFVVLINTSKEDKIQATADAQVVAEKILTELEKPFYIDDYDFRTSASIGIAMFIDTEHSIDDLMKYADSAMHNAKANGRNTFRFFDPVLQKMIEERAHMINRLRKAIENNFMALHYQNQILVNRHQHVVGVEALLRWNDPEYGMISPGEFIPLAEESGLIIPLGEWIIREAAQQLKIWEEDPIKKDWRISVNISYKQFEKEDFVSVMRAILQEYKADSKRLRLELTESLLIKNTQDALDKINQLKALGLTLSIDDFGTGYSSLSYLKQLPIDELKIDQSFIRDLTSNRNDVIIVETIISIGQKFGFEVIAEGVETEEQYEQLVSMGCEYFQGYLFGRPVEPSYL